MHIRTAIAALSFACVLLSSPEANGQNRRTLSAGSYFTCAITSTGGVACWGSNSHGQLGNGTVGGVQLRPEKVNLPAVAVEVEAGERHACALLVTGAVYCWGANEKGQLGDNSTTTRGTPAPVWGFSGGGRATSALSVSAATAHTCLVKLDRTAWCWGDNQWGQIGDGTTADRMTPWQVTELTNVTTVAVGGASSFAIAGGTLKAWGSNEHGALGINRVPGSIVPVDVTYMNRASDVEARGYGGACAVQMGQVYCWGLNEDGQLGNGSTKSSLAPEEAKLSGAAPHAHPALAGGIYHSCVVQMDGAVQCWGRGTSGQLGTGTLQNALTPTPMLTPPHGTAVEVTGGGYFTCVRTRDGAVYCAGANGFGQLGDGTTTPSATPVLAMPPGTAVDVAEGEGPTSSATLSGAFPSPARDGTRLVLDVPVATHISVRVFDVTGRERERLFDGNASGRTELRVDTRALPSGVYQLVVIGEGVRLSRPVVVVR